MQEDDGGQSEDHDEGGCEAFTDPGEGGKIHTGCLTSQNDADLHHSRFRWFCGSPPPRQQVLFTSCQLDPNNFLLLAIDGLQEPLTLTGRTRRLMAPLSEA